MSSKTSAFASVFCWSPRLGLPSLGTCRPKPSPLVSEPLEGFVEQVQNERRQTNFMIRCSCKFKEYQGSREKLKAEHGHDLKLLFKQLQNHTTWAAELMRKLPIMEELVEAMQTSHGDHARATTPAALRESTESRLQHPNYGKLFHKIGLISLPEGHQGRKPPVGVCETQSTSSSHGHGDWWMRQGGFEDERLGGNSERAQAGYHSRWLVMARRQS